MKILIAEDDNFLANAYRMKLTKEGFEIKIVADGEDVFVVLQEFKPDLILLDLVMPKKDGFAVLKELKANDQYKSIPVLVASNLGQQEDRETCEKLGAVGFIVKSDLSMQDLIVQIKQHLSLPSN